MNIEEERDFIYQLFDDNWQEDKTPNRHWDKDSGYGIPICNRCRYHWWSHWVYLKKTTDRRTKLSKV